jgi:hypothetical protein
MHGSPLEERRGAVSGTMHSAFPPHSPASSKQLQIEKKAAKAIESKSSIVIQNFSDGRWFHRLPIRAFRGGIIYRVTHFLSASPTMALTFSFISCVWKRLAVGVAIKFYLLEENGKVVSTAMQALLATHRASSFNAVDCTDQSMRTMLQAKSRRKQASGGILRCVCKWGKASKQSDEEEFHMSGAWYGIERRWMCGVVASWLLAGVDDQNRQSTSTIDENLPTHQSTGIQVSNPHLVHRRKANVTGAFDAFLNELVVADDGQWKPTEEQIHRLQVFMRQNSGLFTDKTQAWIEDLTNTAESAKYNIARRLLGIFLTRKMADRRKCRKRTRENETPATNKIPTPASRLMARPVSKSMCTGVVMNNGALNALATVAISVPPMSSASAFSCATSASSGACAPSASSSGCTTPASSWHAASPVQLGIHSGIQPRIQLMQHLSSNGGRAERFSPRVVPPMPSSSDTSACATSASSSTCVSCAPSCHATSSMQPEIQPRMQRGIRHLSSSNDRRSDLTTRPQSGTNENGVTTHGRAPVPVFENLPRPRWCAEQHHGCVERWFLRNHHTKEASQLWAHLLAKYSSDQLVDTPTALAPASASPADGRGA